MSEEDKPLYARLASVSLNRAKKSVWADYQPERPTSEVLPASQPEEQKTNETLPSTETLRILKPVPDQEPVPEKIGVPEQIPASNSIPVTRNNPLAEKIPAPNTLPGDDSQTGSPPQTVTLPLRKTPVTNQIPVTDEQPDLILQDNAAHLRFPYEVLDKILFDLKPGPHVILERLYRLSAGWDKNTCRISIPKLASTCKVGLTQTRQYLKELEMKGYITRLGEDVTNPNIEIRGVEFRINLPRMPPPKKKPATGTGTGHQSDTGSKSEPIKYKNYKEQSHKTGDDLVANADAEKTSSDRQNVSGASKFSLAECKLYADHLHKTGQGIVNPGGYATTIYRTGEADSLIESFLNPEPSPSKISIANCPDCHGTGMYYPEGYEKGAAKCRHEKLT